MSSSPATMLAPPHFHEETFFGEQRPPQGKVSQVALFCVKWFKESPVPQAYGESRSFVIPCLLNASSAFPALPPWHPLLAELQLMICWTEISYRSFLLALEPFPLPETQMVPIVAEAAAKAQQEPQDP